MNKTKNKEQNKEQKRIFFKKDGSQKFCEWGGRRTIAEFNKDFSDWIYKYYEDDTSENIPRCENWAEALEVLNTVGASARAGWFYLVGDNEKPEDILPTTKWSVIL